jgi:SAM-dependent methyltransferase
VTTPARYDAVAEWYEQEFVRSDVFEAHSELALRLLGNGPGRLLDVGCGGGARAVTYSGAGWSVVGVDVSTEQLEYARRRGIEVVEADAEALPFADGEFDAAVATWLHTDVDDFAQVVREVARVLGRDAPFVYVGAHPCFVGPHSEFVGAAGIPTLHPGYFRTDYYRDGPAVSAAGLRAKVGATHLPLGPFVQTFLDAGLQLEAFEEPPRGEYPFMLALRLRR